MRRSFEYEPVLARGVFFGWESDRERTGRGIEISLVNGSRSVYCATYVKMIVAGSRPSLDPESRPISSASYSNPEPDHRRIDQLPGSTLPSRLSSKPIATARTILTRKQSGQSQTQTKRFVQVHAALDCIPQPRRRPKGSGKCGETGGNSCCQVLFRTISIPNSRGIERETQVRTGRHKGDGRCGNSPDS
jgi:hypothetical protein